MAETNAHIREFLIYYVAQMSFPSYAVMLKGPWGIGKTFFMKRLLQSLDAQQDPPRHIYVSLFGCKSVAEIDYAILCAIYPIVNKKLARLSSRIASIALRYFNIDFHVNWKEVLPDRQPDLYVFDDLERSDISPSAALGYLNQIIEHEGRKVIILCNEDEISEKHEYERLREKVVGKTFSIQSSHDEAIPYFIDSVSFLPCRGLFQRNYDQISYVYEQSALNNLRIVQRALWDFQRTYMMLSEEHRSNDAAMSAFLGLFLVFSLELKAGRVTPLDLSKRMERFVPAMSSRHEEGEKSPIDESFWRYPNVDVFDLIITDDMLVDIIANGVIDVTAVSESLDRSAYFTKVPQRPLWWTVADITERSDDEIMAAFEELELKFKHRQFCMPGEVLHVCGIRLWFSKLGILKKGLAEVAVECKHYIDDVFAEYSTAVVDALRLGGYPDSGYGGMTFVERASDEFKELRSYLFQKLLDLRTRRCAEKAQEMRGVLQTDPSGFAHQLNDDEDDAYGMPVLGFFDVSLFAEAVLKMHPTDQQNVHRAVYLRVSRGMVDLHREKEWLRDLYHEFKSKLDSLAPLSKARLETNLRHYCDIM
jgi:hypothetical protein